MKFLLKNHFENAIEALRSNRLRTGLTLVGITIGIASITTILSLAHGTTTLFANDTTDATTGVALIRSGIKPPASSLLTDIQQPLTTNTLTLKDVTALSALPDATVAPMALLHTNLTAGDQTISAEKITILGTTKQFFTIANLSLSDGEFTDDVAGVVIGQQLAIDLFGTEQAIGNVLKIRGEPLTVIGLLKKSAESQASYLGIDVDRLAIVPVGISKQFTENVPQIQQIVLKGTNSASFASTIDKARGIMTESHDNDHDYHFLTGTQITEPSSRMVSAITLVVAVIAGISLLVGGISIMNIMLASVAERQREVGIRKAIGATNFQIINQFLIESAIVGCIGGIIGYSVGIGSAYLLGMYLPFEPSLQWQVALLAISTAIITGVMFGLYPAVRAAQKDPIETLRY